MIRVTGVTIATVLLLLPLVGYGQEDRGIEIRGVDERPGVLHLVPWQLPEDDLPEAPRVDGSRFERIIEPVDDRVHRRHMQFRQNPAALLEALSTD
ncbi:hypothetical protein DES49_3039 [Halospina denitrificans]|uniref:Uncharacterized protein n=1 Tax=Halospina denitrificans TaxID=332522 RepID=A0A4R7JJ60_9GAMM|nr:hypothetical protein [Halospina denitrificans]TDT37087.1 hypothetical protein DES49_3039 [Halospina denitrificans]